MKRTRLYWQSTLIVAFAAVGTLFAAQMGDALKIPGDFKHWYLVHSTLITKNDNTFGLIAGVHLIYVNATGLDRLKRGGSTPYPDGTIFTDDVRDFSATDGIYLQGPPARPSPSWSRTQRNTTATCPRSRRTSRTQSTSSNGNVVRPPEALIDPLGEQYHCNGSNSAD